MNPALQKPLQPSKQLAAVVGSDPLPRAQVVSRVWDYIKQQWSNLRDPHQTNPPHLSSKPSALQSAKPLLGMPRKEVSAQTFGVRGQLHENECPSP